MSPTRSIFIAAFLGASSQLRAEEVATETTPVESPASSETLDPTADGPRASDLPAAPVAAAPAPSPNVTVNLINRLVQKGILSQAEAAEMIQQAEADAATAAQNAAAQADIAALPPAPNPDEMRVTYIPEVVKNNMRDQIKQELMAAAREEKWSEKKYPDWTSKFRPFGDIRMRYQGNYFPSGNDDTGSFPNFNAINTGQPYDTSPSNPNFAPQRNVNEDRERVRIRARVGTDVIIGDGFNAGFRIASGDSNSPVTTNQTLGASGGNFSKYSVWLDRAFLSYDAGPGHGEELVFMAGRFDSPFFSTDMHWDNDLGFDGFGLRGKVKMNEKVSTFFAAGYFPVYNTEFSFASNQPSKFPSTNKWLTGAQIGIDWKIDDDWKTKFAVAYYGFDGVQGKLSEPYTPLGPADAGNTDTTRPSFAQNGNTYIPLRNIVPDSANDFGNISQYQYFGLASEFQNIALTGKLTYEAYDPVAISLVGEITQNLAFDVDEATAKGNRGPDDNYEGGDTAWYTALQVGMPALQKFGDWQVAFGYRYVESDAVVDAFTDSNFNGGGTNTQGYTIGADFALSPFVKMSLVWMSANEIAGPPLSQDILQLDISAKF
jgi:hypothetical protein